MQEWPRMDEKKTKVGEESVPEMRTTTISVEV